MVNIIIWQKYFYYFSFFCIFFATLTGVEVLLPQPPRQEPVYSIDEGIADGVILINFTSEEENEIKEALASLFTEQCTRAFDEAKLRSPLEVALSSGMIIRPSADLYINSAKLLGLRYERTRLLYAAEFSSGRAQAGTISVMAGVRLTLDGRPRIFLHDTAFLGESLLFRRLSLRQTLIHESVHMGGQPPSPGVFGPLRDDLAGFGPYARIIEACK
jgi:hypothetical protein